MSLSLQNCWSNRNWLIGRPTQDSVSLAELALEPGNFGGALLQSVAEVGLWIRRLRRSFNLSILPISLNKLTDDKPPFGWYQPRLGGQLRGRCCGAAY